MDKIQKALNKLSQKEKSRIKGILSLISRNEFSRLDVKKLKGRSDLYRARFGQIRIIYRVERNSNVSILSIERRSDIIRPIAFDFF